MNKQKTIKRFSPGTPVLWGRERWTVIQWQPHNGKSGAYWLQNAKGEDGVAGQEEIVEAKQ